MKKKLLTIGAFLSFTAFGFGISHVVYPPNKTLHNYHELTSALDDEQYVVFKSESPDKWSILSPSGNITGELSNRQVSRFFFDGMTDTTNIFPSTTEYQLEMEDEYLIIKDGKRHVAKVYYKDAGIVATELIADNE